MAERAGAARKATTTRTTRTPPGAAAKKASGSRPDGSTDAEKTAAQKAAGAAQGPRPPVTAADREGLAETPAGQRSRASRGAGAGKRAKADKAAKTTTTRATRPATRSVSREEKAITKSAPAKGSRPAADMEEIRTALIERRDELRAEYEQTLVEIADLQRDRFTDSAGDDQADTGTKTFEREQEISLANGILERINQAERALERVEDGNYGSCERCGNPIPVERLAAFPAATLCIPCKQLEERR